MDIARDRNLVSFWHGKLGWMEELCLKSLRATGQRIAIYTYEPRAVIDGVEWRDAGEIIGTDDPIYPELGSSAQFFANLFRYELLARGAGLWIDLDLYFLKPMGPMPDHLYCWEKPTRVNNAVLLLPPDSPALAELIRFVRKRPIYAPWWRPKHKLKQSIAIALGRPLPLSAFPKGQFGPKALTWFLDQHGLLDRATPQDVFYPVGPENHADLIAPDSSRVDRAITERTIAVHLWSNGVKRLLAGERPPAGSYLGRLLAG